jgi:large subunit ribosomal protein L28
MSVYQLIGTLQNSGNGMSQQCEICGKKPVMGNSVTTRGKAKYLGGVGTKVTGISRRQFKPNLQTLRITTAGGTNKTARVCTQCIRSGAVTKRVRQAPFKLPSAKTGAGKAAPAKTGATKATGKKAPAKV